jgi:hypothetical protein
MIEHQSVLAHALGQLAAGLVGLLQAQRSTETELLSSCLQDTPHVGDPDFDRIT